MTTERVMLLIDADNVSVDVMDQAVRLLLKQHGALHVRRAYCTAESAVANQAIFKHLGIKPMVNLAAGKNSTDIALAVDAIDLVLAERPDVVAIASSDSDFAPLVQRLREKGCVVRGIGQAGKTGDETQGVYDEFTVLEHRKGAEAVVVPGRKPARKTAARKTAATKTAAKAPATVAGKDAGRAATKPAAGAAAKTSARTAAKKTAAARKATLAAVPEEEAAAPVPDAPAAQAPGGEAAAPAAAAKKTSVRKTAAAKKAPAAKKTPARKTAKAAAGQAAASAAAEVAPAEPPPASAPAPAPAPAAAAGASAGAMSDERPAATLDAVLQCLPELARGQPLALNVAVERLKLAKLMSKSGKSPRFFAQFGSRFELLPPDHPAQVRLRG